MTGGESSWITMFEQQRKGNVVRTIYVFLPSIQKLLLSLSLSP